MQMKLDAFFFRSVRNSLLRDRHYVVRKKAVIAEIAVIPDDTADTDALAFFKFIYYGSDP